MNFGGSLPRDQRTQSMMDRRNITKILNYLYDYKGALIEKVNNKIMGQAGPDGNPEYGAGDFTVEDFLDMNAMKLSHLNILLCEYQAQLDVMKSQEKALKSKELVTEVYDIPREDYREMMKFHLDGLNPSEVRWINVERIDEETFCLTIVKKIEV